LSEAKKKAMGDLLVAVTVYTGVAQILMQRMLRTGTDEAEIDDLNQALRRRLKGLEIQGLQYDQQAQLVGRAIADGDRFFETYRNKIRARNDQGPGGLDAPQEPTKPTDK